MMPYFAQQLPDDEEDMTYERIPLKVTPALEHRVSELETAISLLTTELQHMREDLARIINQAGVL